MSHLIRFVVFLAIAVLVAGCKVAVIVVEGGEVQSIGSVTCLEGEICMVQVNDTNFSDAFTAVPNPGWHFVKWNSGEGFFCGDSTDPTCVLSTEGTAGDAGIEAIIASDQTFYIMPIFRPEPDTVTVDGKEWAQVDQFTNLSWDDINAVCPAGVCSGVLNGYNMTGWTWASVDDVNALFNYYIGSDELGPGPTAATTVSCSVTGDFFGDGWRDTGLDPRVRVHLGWMRSPGMGVDGVYTSWAGPIPLGAGCMMWTDFVYGVAGGPYVGWWFWRSL